jgi:signal transduction histidine kinase
MVAVSVIDNGPGIPPDVEADVRTFFTTKPIGQGPAWLDISRRVYKCTKGDRRERGPGTPSFASACS